MAEGARGKWGFTAETLSLVFELEKVIRSSRYDRATVQHSLASALWRATAQHAELLRTVDMSADSITLRDGGRSIKLELNVYPPEGTPAEDA